MNRTISLGGDRYCVLPGLEFLEKATCLHQGDDAQMYCTPQGKYFVVFEVYETTADGDDITTYDFCELTKEEAQRFLAER